MQIKMFDVFYADLSGSEKIQDGVRPVVIIQNDKGNKFSPTVICLPLTSKIKKTELPTHCVIHKSSETGMKRDSMVLGEQVIVLNKDRLIDKIGHVTDEKEQDDIIMSYLANITGEKHYIPLWRRAVNSLCFIVREGTGTKNASQDSNKKEGSVQVSQ